MLADNMLRQPRWAIATILVFLNLSASINTIEHILLNHQEGLGMGNLVLSFSFPLSNQYWQWGEIKPVLQGLMHLLLPLVSI